MPKNVLDCAPTLSYYTRMNISRLIWVLLRPSLLSGVLSLGFAAGLLGLSNWSYFTYNPWLYDFFFGAYGLVTAVERSPNGFVALQDTVLRSAFSYNALIFCGAIFIGAATFVLIRAARHMQIGTLRLLKRMSSATKSQRRLMTHTLAEHIVVEALVLATWMVYALVTFNFVVPYSMLLARIGAERIIEFDGLVKVSAAVILLFVATHAHVIFARLVMRRPRLFGGQAAIDSALSR